MSLKKIRDDLLNKDSYVAKRKHNVTLYNEWEKKKAEDSSEDVWSQKSDPVARVKMNATLLGALVISIVFIVVVGIYLIVQYNRGYYLANNLSFSTEAPRETESNRAIEVIFNYYNNNRSALENAEIYVKFDQYFIPEETADFQKLDDRSGIISIGTIAPRESSSVRLVGQFVAPQNEVEVIAGTLTYEVVGRNLKGNKKTNSSVTITSSPLVLDMIAPKEVASGNDVSLQIAFRNTGDIEINDLGISLEYPKGFIFRDATPPHEDDGKWNVGSLLPGEQGDIVIRGTLTGEVEDIKTFRAQMTRASEDALLRYTGDDHNFRIIEAPIKIEQRIAGQNNSIVRAGERIMYNIEFQNTTGIPLRNIILKTFIDGSDNIDYKNISASDNGFFDVTNKSIEWKAVNVPSLANLGPGQSGRVDFRVPIKDIIPISDLEDENITISTIVIADSPDFPDLIKQNKDVLSNTLISRLQTKLLLNMEGEVIDGTFPLEAGKPTTVRMKLKAGTVSNDIDDAVVKGFIGSGIKILGVVDGEEETIILNERTNAFEWKVGNVENATGILRDAREVQFDIVVTPAINTQLENINLLQNVSFSAQDLFINKKVQIKGLEYGASQMSK